MSQSSVPSELRANLGLVPEMVLNSLNAGVYVTDTERRIIYWNETAQRITGWRAEDVLGKACLDQVLCHVDKDNRALCGKEFCPLHRAITTGTSSDVPIVVYALSREGGRVPMRVSVAPLRDGAGNIVGGVETFQDLRKEVSDLRRAQRIQSQCLVNDAADDPELAVRVHYAPHDMTGGDFCAISRIGADRYAFILADVMGHGVSAALYTMFLRSLWDEHCRAGSPSVILATINQRLAGVMADGGEFATALCGVLVGHERLLFSSAGGPAPLLVRDGECEPVSELEGTPLGLFKEGTYEEVGRSLRPGDRLLMFTDGVVEVADREGRILDTDGLIGLLRELRYPRVELEMGALEERMLTYSNGIRFSDDVTLVEMHRREAAGR